MSGHAWGRSVLHGVCERCHRADTSSSQQFAYNEASFVIVRLLQTFESFSVAQAEAAPAGSLPPASWKSMEDRRGVEECIPQSAMTLYAKVGLCICLVDMEADCPCRADSGSECTQLRRLSARTEQMPAQVFETEVWCVFLGHLYSIFLGFVLSSRAKHVRARL